MNIKSVSILMVAGLAFVGAANAQMLTGSITVTNHEGPFGPGSATDSSLEFSPTNVIVSTTGDFSSIVPQYGVLTAHSQTISGLSTSPLSDPINDFFYFSALSPYSGGGPGSTPSNRFDFDLATITEDSYDSDTGAALFTGTGTIVDRTGDYQTTPADFTVDFSGPGIYTLEIDVPEPATLSLAAAGLLGLLAFRRRKGW